MFNYLLRDSGESFIPPTEKQAVGRNKSESEENKIFTLAARVPHLYRTKLISRWS